MSNNKKDRKPEATVQEVTPPTFAERYHTIMDGVSAKVAKVAEKVAARDAERKEAKRAALVIASPESSTPEELLDAVRTMAKAKKAAKGLGSQVGDLAAAVAEDSAVLLAQDFAIYAAMRADADAIRLQEEATAAKVAADTYRADARKVGVRNVSRKRAAEANQRVTEYLRREGITF